MTGKIDFMLKSPKVVYNFTIKRNITFLKDNSGKGKSHLYDLVDDVKSRYFTYKNNIY